MSFAPLREYNTEAEAKAYIDGHVDSEIAVKIHINFNMNSAQLNRLIKDIRARYVIFRTNTGKYEVNVD